MLHVHQKESFSFLQLWSFWHVDLQHVPELFPLDGQSLDPWPERSGSGRVAWFHRETYWILIKLQCVWKQRGPSPWGGTQSVMAYQCRAKHCNGYIPGSSEAECWCNLHLLSPQPILQTLHAVMSSKPALWGLIRLSPKLYEAADVDWQTLHTAICRQQQKATQLGETSQ